MKTKKRENPEGGLVPALRLSAVRQAMCLQGISNLEKAIDLLAKGMNEGFGVIEDMIASQRGCELWHLLQKKPEIPPRKRKK